MNHTFLHAAFGRILPESITVSVSEDSFDTNPPVCILSGVSSGGPPTTYIWKKNRFEIRNGTTYTIEIQILDFSTRSLEAGIYVSRLTVRGRFPGVYSYSVGNIRESSLYSTQFKLSST